MKVTSFTSSKYAAFLAGGVCALSFAPIFFLPGIFCLAILARQIHGSVSRKQSLKYGYMFGFGFYLVTLYWISFGVSVYINEFWWAIPFALFGLPAFVAIFTALATLISWHGRTSSHFHFLFCINWIFIEWVVSWIFTGLPWGLIGYAFSNWLVLTQFASIAGILGLGFVAVYIGSAPYTFEGFRVRATVSVFIIAAMLVYGTIRLNNNQTEYTNISARLVQPSIVQQEKWSPESFWQNLQLHTLLSSQYQIKVPDIIIWSEAALTVPYTIPSVMQEILTIFQDSKQILLSGGVADHAKGDDEPELYSALIGIKPDGSKILEYNKSHLVPFGEYMPLKNILPFKKLTPGLIDYTKGTRKEVTIKDYNLTVWPLICYESIFSDEVRVSNKKADLIVNITNDAWYGNSFGPYQHFEISRMRAIENGLPMLRVANNGISGVIDPAGRVLSKTKLNEVTFIDSHIPEKLREETLFSRYGLRILLLTVCLMLILELTIRGFFK